MNRVKMFKDNFQAFLNKEGMNTPKFSQIVEIKKGTIYSWLNEGKEPKYDSLVQIKQKYREKLGKDINIDYLITGEGGMFMNETIQPSEELRQMFNEDLTTFLKKYGLIDKIK